MTEDDAARGLPTCPATYLLRDGIPVCTTCGAVIGAADADQIRHSTWHTTLAALFAVADLHNSRPSLRVALEERGDLRPRASLDQQPAAFRPPEARYPQHEQIRLRRHCLGRQRQPPARLTPWLTARGFSTPSRGNLGRAHVVAHRAAQHGRLGPVRARQ